MTWDHPHPFTLPVCPGPADIDGLGHTNNAVYVQWCERIGWAHSEALGLSLADYHRLDRAMAIQRGEYDYLLPTFAGDTLTLATWLMPGDGKLRMERHFQLQRQGPGDGGLTTVLRGRWQLVCIAISSGAPKRMPPEFVQAYLPACVTVGC